MPRNDALKAVPRSASARGWARSRNHTNMGMALMAYTAATISMVMGTYWEALAPAAWAEST